MEYITNIFSLHGTVITVAVPLIAAVFCAMIRNKNAAFIIASLAVTISFISSVSTLLIFNSGLDDEILYRLGGMGSPFWDRV
jgi:hypothetical protein